MIDSIAVSKALSELGGASSFNVDSDSILDDVWYEKVVWEGDVSKPTLAELKAKMEELQIDFDSKQYQRDRQGQYPPIGDQLDALYHTGVFPDEMAAKLKAVKDANPKG
jgi:hypothetical protein